MKRILLILLFIGLHFTVGLGYSTNYCVGATTNFTCGDTITESCVMNGSMSTTSSCFVIGADNITFDCDGYTIDGDDLGTNKGIYNNDHDNVTIQECNVTDFYYGIYFYERASNCTIINNTIFSNNRGLYLYSAFNTSVINNNFTSNNRGLHFFHGDNSTITNNIFILNIIGVFVDNADHNIITNNTLSLNTIGSYIYYNNVNNVFTNNTFNQSNNMFLEHDGTNKNYHNYFYNGSTYHISNEGASHTFNNSAGEGNYYDDITSWDIFDSDDDGYGDTGDDYPYNSDQTKWIGNGADYGPIILPYIGCVNLSDASTFGTNITKTDNIFYINSDTTLCTDTYETAEDYLLSFDCVDCFLDCNSSVLNGTGIGINSSNDKTNVSNCEIINFATGVNLDTSDNSKFTNNTIHNTTTAGVFNSQSNNTLFENNNISYNDVYGYWGVDSDYVNLTNNTINNCLANVFQDENSDFGYFANNTLNNSSFSGLVLYQDSNNNTVINNSFNNNSQYGLYVQDSDNNTIQDNTACGNTLGDIELTINSANNSGDNICTNLNDDDSNTVTCNNNCVGIIYITDCMTLNTANSFYHLINNINTSDTTCFSLTAENVTLFCDNHYINGSGGTAGVRIKEDNATVKNCEILNWVSDIEIFDSDVYSYAEVYNNILHNATSQGLYLRNADNGVFYNNSVYWNDKGIYIYGIASDFGTVYNWDFYNNSLINNSRGVYGASNIPLTGLNFTDNNISYNSGYGVYLPDYFTNGALNNNTIIGNRNTGVDIAGYNWDIDDNTISNNTGTGLYLRAAVINSKIERNVIENNNGNGIYLLGDSNDFSYNIIRYNTLTGFYLHGSASGNNIYDTTSCVNDQQGRGLYYDLHDNGITSVVPIGDDSFKRSIYTNSEPDDLEDYFAQISTCEWVPSCICQGLNNNMVFFHSLNCNFTEDCNLGTGNLSTYGEGTIRIIESTFTFNRMTINSTWADGEILSIEGGNFTGNIINESG